MGELIPGVTIVLNGQEYILPPLNVDALEAYWETIQSWAAPPESLIQRLLQVTEVIHAALTRNYPELALQEVKRAVDLRNFEEMVGLLLEGSGLVGKSPGESEAGEALTGVISGPESSPSPAGPGNTSAAT